MYVAKTYLIRFRFFYTSCKKKNAYNYLKQYMMHKQSSERLNFFMHHVKNSKAPLNYSKLSCCFGLKLK